MNVVTVCRPDEWVDTQLARWRWSLYRTTPSARCFLIIPFGVQHTSEEARNAMSRVAGHFDGVRTIREQVVPGFSVWMDSLRASSVTAFGLTEALYMDADADAVEDLSAIPAWNGADILWTPNAAARSSVVRALKAFGLPCDPPFVEPAVMYLRRDFAAEYADVVNAGLLDTTDYLPGVNAWNVVVSRCRRAAILPHRYNVMYQHMLKPGTDPAIIHFCGKAGKKARLATGLNDWPHAVTIHRRGCERLPVEWEDSEHAWREAVTKT